MQKYKSNITTTSGAAVRGVPVHVLAEDGSPASIFLDRAGTVQAANPLSTASDGTFYFYAENGRYSLRTTVDGVTITDADVALLWDPAEVLLSGPLAEAVERAEASAAQAEAAVADSGIVDLVASAQNAVVDAQLALAEASGLGQAAQEAEDAAASAVLASQVATDAANLAVDAAQDAILASAATIKAYATHAEAAIAAALLPDGADVEVSQDETRAGARTRYKVQAGALVFVVNLDQTKLDLAAATGASLVGFQQDGTGAVPRTLQDKARESVSVADFDGIDPTGTTDSTAGFALQLAKGGEIAIGAGDYLIAGTGPDSGGVAVVLTRSLRVKCHPQARFFTDSLDNDFFRFTVPTNGAGLPVGGIEFEWIGGLFDKRNQKTSMVVPFLTEYPSSNQGASNTAEAIYVDGSCNRGAGIVAGINTARVIGATFDSGDHWQTSGGDGHIFMGGCKKHEVLYCHHKGSRDSGFYSSSDATGAVLSKATAIGNLYENCFVGAKQQRSAGDVEFSGNTFVNCPRAMAVEWGIGAGAQSGNISGNTGRGCGIPVRMTLVSGFSVTDNHFTDAGCTLADGVTIESFAGLDGFVLRGATNCTVRGNTVLGVKPTAASAYLLNGNRLLVSEDFNPGSGAVKTTGCRFQENISNGVSRLGADSGDRNSFIDNLALNAVTANMGSLGTNAVEVRVSPTTGLRNFNTPVGFADGTAAAPTIARAGQTTTGVFFGTNKVALSSGGSEKLSATNVGVSFHGKAPEARPVYAPPTGTATRTTFETSTVTTAQLAERVKALIDDLRAYGLAG